MKPRKNGKEFWHLLICPVGFKLYNQVGSNWQTVSDNLLRYQRYEVHWTLWCGGIHKINNNKTEEKATIQFYIKSKHKLYVVSLHLQEPYREKYSPVASSLSWNSWRSTREGEGINKCLGIECFHTILICNAGVLVTAI